MSENFESLYGGSDLISSWSLIAKFRIVSEAEYNHLFRCKSEFKKNIRLTLRASICFKLVHNLLFLTTIPIKGDPEVGSISAVSRVRSLILPEERLSGDECGLIFPNSGW